MWHVTMLDAGSIGHWVLAIPVSVVGLWHSVLSGGHREGVDVLPSLAGSGEGGAAERSSLGAQS